MSLTLRKLLQRTAQARRRPLSIEEAVVANRFGAYCWRRLRLFLGRFSLVFLIHAAEAYFLYEIFSQRGLLKILVIRNLIFLLGSLWWGYLEEMRIGIQATRARHARERLHASLQRWTNLSLRLGAAVVVLIAIWLAWAIRANAGVFGVIHAVVTVAWLRFAIELPLRSFHSGAFALRRVYRPLGAILGTEFASLATVLLLWQRYGPWTFPIAQLVGTVSAGALSFHYVRRAYETAGLLIPRWRLRKAELPDRAALGRALVPGLAYVLTRFDSVVILAILWGAGTSARLADWVVLMHLLTPFIGASADVAAMFYFDYRKLADRIFRHARERLSTRLIEFSVAFALGGGGIGVLAVVVANLEVPLALASLLVPVLLLRAWLAVYQVRDFSERLYGRLLVVGAGKLIALGILSYFSGEIGLPLTFGGFAAVIASAALTLRGLRRRGFRSEIHREPLTSLPAWWANLALRGEPLAFGRCRLRNGYPSGLLEPLHRELVTRLGDPHRVLSGPDGWLHWAESPNRRLGTEGAQRLREMGGGLLEIQMTVPEPIPFPAPAAQLPAGEGIAEEFRRAFPEGRLWNWASAESRDAEVDPADAAAVFEEIALAAGWPGRSPRAKLAWEIQVFNPEGPIEWVFLVPKSAANLAARLQWRKSLAEFSRGELARRLRL